MSNLAVEMSVAFYLLWGLTFAVAGGFCERTTGRSDAEVLARGLAVTAVWPLVMMWAFLRGRDGR